MMTDLTYALTDIHGRFDLLKQALKAIEAHADGRPYYLMFLGDYVDRGPNSKQVIEKLMAMQADGVAMTALLGNHEEMFIDAFRHRQIKSEVKFWLDNGGDATAESYGADIGWGKPSFWPLIPHAHIEWMESLPRVTQYRGRLFVHAGFRPHVPPDEQAAADVIWIRDRFLNASKGFEGWPYIVHGHTPETAPEPNVLSWRCGLDAASWVHGRLNVGVFEGDGGPPSHIIRVGPLGYRVQPVEVVDES